MGSYQTPLENRDGQALRIGEVGACTHAARQGAVGRVATTLQRFTGNPSPLVSGSPWGDTGGALAQPCAAADAVDRRRFSKASSPGG
jgi:hypothetical protein